MKRSNSGILTLTSLRNKELYQILNLNLRSTVFLFLAFREDSCLQSLNCSFNSPFLFPSEVSFERSSLTQFSNQGVEKIFLNKRNCNTFQNGIFKCDLRYIMQNSKMLTIITDTENARSMERNLGVTWYKVLILFINKLRPRSLKRQNQVHTDQMVQLEGD